MAETVDDYGFVVYPPASPGLPWLSVCFGPDGAVLDAEAFGSFEEADLVTQRAREVLQDSFLQRKLPPAGAAIH
ncbi:hypothetical protein [Methylobacterium nigriterrae]|uniref:hypothetical protein n=1 Tax=Methylobacterium nigriterrae TaxID=3127512 RepID=UPI003013EDB9